VAYLLAFWAFQPLPALQVEIFPVWQSWKTSHLRERCMESYVQTQWCILTRDFWQPLYGRHLRLLCSIATALPSLKLQLDHDFWHLI